MPKPSPHCSIKSGKAGNGASHAEYIGGGGKYAEREDVLQVVDMNMPTWAKDGVAFFHAADKLERANGRAYTEIEAAIPRGAADPVAYATEYAEQLLGKNHPYRLAVHDKPAADGGRNIHMHLMFSDRKLDGIERDREQFFKRAAAPYRHRITKEMMPADPAKGGAGKDRKWNDRKQVQAVRDGWQEHAKARGFDLDLRSNAAKGLEAPEPKLGPQHPRAGADPAREQRQAEVERLRQVRAIKAELRSIDDQQEHKNAKNIPNFDRFDHFAPRPQRAGADRMHQLRGEHVVHDAQQPDVLLPSHALGHVEHSDTYADQSVRHGSVGRRSEDLIQAEQPEPVFDIEKYKADLFAKAEARAAQEKTAVAEAVAAQRKAAWKANRPERWKRRISGLQNTIHSPDGKRGERQVYTWKEGPAAGRPVFIDHGYALVVAGNPTVPKIKAMAEHAKQKWPEGVFLKGNAEWKAMALPELLAKGVIVKNQELQADVEKWHAAERAAAEKAQAEELEKAQMEEQERQRNIQRAQQAAARPSIEQQVKTAADLREKVALNHSPHPSLSEPSKPAQPEAAPQPQPQPTTLKALQSELATLKKEEWALKNEVKQHQPEPFDDSRAAAQARELAVKQINDEAKALGYSQALPANQWENEWNHGWGGQRDRTERALDEHRKTPKPLMFGRSEWEQKDKQLSAEAEQWKGWVKSRDARLAQLTTGKLHQVKQEYRQKHAEQPEKLAEAEKRLAANQHRKTEIERMLKEPPYPDEIKREKERQQGLGKGRGR